MEELMKRHVELLERLAKAQEVQAKSTEHVCKLVDTIYEMAVNEYTEQKKQELIQKLIG